ncbi:hypothetical protein [uncultured Polaribacter sp.]|uniref:hypothetical protein n=1 Tax=uncultured Polaribacter sp. TaxID=174711 RepID=UPI0030DA7A94
MKKAILFFAILFSVMIISAQKKIPEAQRSSYTIRSHSPSGDGYILSNINFTSNVVLTQPERDKYVWQANIYEKTNTIVEGYIYNGKRYSNNELLNDFNIGLSKPYFKVKVVFNNGKSFTGWSTSGQKYDYVKNDENTSFGIRSISIVGNLRDTGIETTIKRELAIKEQKRKNEEFKKKEEERLRIEAENKKIEEERIEAENKKIEEERLRVEEEKRKKREEKLEELEKDVIKIQEEKEKANKERFRIEKEAIDRKFELEKKEREKQREIDAKNSADAAAASRRIAKRREEERKKKQAAEINRASRMGAKAITGTLSALSDWDESFIGFRMSTRTLFSGAIEDSFSPTTYEFTMGQGGAGFFIGYGSPEIGNDSFGTMIGGLEKQLFNVNNIFKIGLIVEGGKGDLWDNTDDRSDGQQDEVWFYGGGLYIKLLKYAYFSYTVGNSHFNKETTTWIERDSSTETSEFTELYSGLRFGINIPL